MYGDQNSKITEQHIKSNLDGLSVEEVHLSFQLVDPCRGYTINFTVLLTMDLVDIYYIGNQEQQVIHTGSS